MARCTAEWPDIPTEIYFNPPRSTWSEVVILHCNLRPKHLGFCLDRTLLTFSSDEGEVKTQQLMTAFTTSGSTAVTSRDRPS